MELLTSTEIIFREHRVRIKARTREIKSSNFLVENKKMIDLEFGVSIL